MLILIGWLVGLGISTITELFINSEFFPKKSYDFQYLYTYPM